MAISLWDAERTATRSDDLGRLLCDAVNGGAAIGFLPPLDRDHAWAYWMDVSRSIAEGGVQLLVLEQGDELVGTVQLREALNPNAGHRAEVTQLMVRSLYRRQGHGRQLMLAVQALARGRGRTTLVLDTRSGDRSERLFAALGWVKSGEVPFYARSADGSCNAASFYHLILNAGPG
jgi:ribosomal protein S18 acetylase RimI-like enzyme